jgi:hypothetical protein
MHTERTTLNLPIDRVEKLRKELGLKTKTETIVFAIDELLRRSELLSLSKRLAGSGAVSLTQMQLKKMRRARVFK